MERVSGFTSGRLTSINWSRSVLSNPLQSTTEISGTILMARQWLTTSQQAHKVWHVSEKGYYIPACSMLWPWTLHVLLLILNKKPPQTNPFLSSFWSVKWGLK